MKDTTLYKEILGIEYPWEIEHVDLDSNNEEIDIHISYKSKTAPCPKCGKDSPLYDHRKRRKWRHLDTCQLKTYLISSLPRIECPKDGVLSIQPPWANQNSRVTLMFERFVIDLLLEIKKQKKVADILRISFDQINLIMERAVQRGLVRRDNTKKINYLGIDEKSIGKHHHYASILVDLEDNRVIDLVEKRDEQSARKLIDENLTDEQKQKVKAISMDMWKPYKNAAKKLLPNTSIVIDNFHLMKYLNQAVDQTRRKEIQGLEKEDKKFLKNSRYIFLQNPENWSDKYKTRFEQLDQMNFISSQAWRIKENFKGFWGCQKINEAKLYLKEWLENAKKVNIAPINEVIKKFRNHFKEILNFIKHRITNSLVESINSLIQEIKYIARGFRGFENSRISILFHLGKLDLYPQKIQ